MGEIENTLYEKFYETFEIVHKVESGAFPMPPHIHNAVEIYLVLTDVPHILLGTNVIPFPKNTLLLIPTYCVHRIIVPEELVYERYILTIHTGWLQQVIGKDFEKYFAYFKDGDNPLVFHLDEEEKRDFANMFSSLAKCAKQNRFEKLKIFFDILARMHQLAESNNGIVTEYTEMQEAGPYGLVSAMMNYINTHLNENFTVEDIAGYLHLNHDYAARVFKKYVNVSVKRFVVMQRITKAKQLLLEGHSVSETQNLLGFNSYEHFFKIFKKVTGMTPREYRERYRS